MFVTEENDPPGTEDDHEPVLTEPVINPWRLIDSFTHDPVLPIIVTSTSESITMVCVSVVVPHSLLISRP